MTIVKIASKQILRKFLGRPYQVLANLESRAYDYGEMSIPPSANDNTQAIILKNFSLLKDQGILDLLDKKDEQIRYLQYVIEGALGIVHQTDMTTMLERMAKSFLDRFIPKSLTIIIEEVSGGERPRILSYRNMQMTETGIDIPSLAPYKFFFNLSPISVTFPVFDYMIGREELTKPLLDLEPELVAPIMGFEQVYGFIVVGKKVLEDTYSEQEVAYINSIMKFTSIALQNNLHYSRAVTDLKTKLYNHTFVMNRLEIELDRVKRYKFELAVIITDVDHFKQFNDNYGHLTGDKILLRIAEIFADSVRKGDIAGRFGGEEFVLLLINCSKSDACMAAERIRKRVAALKLVENGKPISVTISLGIRHVCASDLREPATLIDEADKALYKAKQSGRNRTFMYNSPESLAARKG
jgi:diguanylate cyclase (GGDEF)-like protein